MCFLFSTIDECIYELVACYLKIVRVYGSKNYEL